MQIRGAEGQVGCPRSRLGGIVLGNRGASWCPQENECFYYIKDLKCQFPEELIPVLRKLDIEARFNKE
jgi:hypothetical protein